MPRSMCLYYHPSAVDAEKHVPACYPLVTNIHEDVPACYPLVTNIHEDVPACYLSATDAYNRHKDAHVPVKVLVVCTWTYSLIIC